MKVAIAVASGDMVHAQFAQCLAGLVGYSTAKGISVQLITSGGTLIAPQRADLAAEAVQLGADAILWIDSDMVFPVDSLERLAQHGKDIVACVYSTRREPLGTTAFLTEDFDDNLWIDDEAQGLVTVNCCGMGLMLTSTKVFLDLAEPWFDIQYNAELKDWLGEDVYFCRKAGALGFETYIDQDLSKEVGHLGTFEFRHRHANAWRKVQREHR
jgi:hypothetical protein